MAFRPLHPELVRPYRWSVGTALVLGLLLLALSIPALRWQFTAPKIGVGLTSVPSGGAVVTRVQPDGSAAAAGVQPGDTLLSVGQVPVPSAEDPSDLSVFPLALINRYREGQQAPWTVRRDGSQMRLSGTFVGRPHSLTPSRAVVLGAFWVIGLFLLWARPREKTVRLLAFAIFAITAQTLFYENRMMAVNTPLGAVLHQINRLGFFLGPALVIHFGLVFPTCTFSDRARRRILVATYGLYFLAVFVVEEVLFVRTLLSSGPPYVQMPSVLEALHYGRIILWLQILNFLACAVLIYLNGRRADDPTLRDKSKWVLWAVLLTVGIDILAIGTALGTDWLDMQDLYPYRNYLYLLIATGLLTSIFRQDLFDVDVVIRKSALYFCSTAALLVLFTGAQELVAQGLRPFIPARSETIGTLIAAVLTTALLEPVYSKIRTKTQTLLQESGE